MNTHSSSLLSLLSTSPDRMSLKCFRSPAPIPPPECTPMISLPYLVLLSLCISNTKSSHISLSFSSFFFLLTTYSVVALNVFYRYNYAERLLLNTSAEDAMCQTVTHLRSLFIIIIYLASSLFLMTLLDGELLTLL